jgi:hypothetical protein
MNIPGGAPCRNPDCEREVLPVWWFCPHCGRDNRTVKGLAVDQETCDHQFVLEGPCCIVCGYDPAYGTPSELAVKRLGAWIGLGLAIFLTLLVGYFLSRPPLRGERMLGRGLSITMVLALIFLAAMIGYLVNLYRRPPTV